MESSRTRILDDDNENEDIKSGTRRKVTLDPGLLDDLLNFSDEDESEVEEEPLSRQGSLDSIMSHESRTALESSPSQENSPVKTPFKKGHQRRHSLTVCETPKRLVNTIETSSKPRKPPQLVFETQTSTISNVSTEDRTSSSDSVTPTSQHSTPKFRSPSPALDESSLAQMQERLHAEFLQSVSSTKNI